MLHILLHSQYPLFRSFKENPLFCIYRNKIFFNKLNYLIEIDMVENRT